MILPGLVLPPAAMPKPNDAPHVYPDQPAGRVVGCTASFAPTGAALRPIGSFPEPESAGNSQAFRSVADEMPPTRSASQQERSRRDQPLKEKKGNSLGEAIVIVIESPLPSERKPELLFGQS